MVFCAWKAVLFIWEAPFLWKALFSYEKQQKHMCPYMHHIHIDAPHAPPNTHVHHQTPPKYKIYLVGHPSELYKRPGQNERSVLNQLVLLLSRCAFHVPLAFQVLFMCFSLFRCFSCAFCFSGAFQLLFSCFLLFRYFSCAFHMKNTTFHDGLQGYHQVQVFRTKDQKAATKIYWLEIRFQWKYPLNFDWYFRKTVLFTNQSPSDISMQCHFQ